jgi:glycosyltransferase involved in cell wall biosynthesis
MKILFLDHMGDSYSGAQEVLYRTVKLCLSRGLDCRLFLPSKGRFYKRMRACGIPVARIRFPGLKPALFRRYSLLEIVKNFFIYIAFNWNVALYVRRHKIDLIFANTIFSLAYSALAARLAGAKIVWHCHDSFSPARNRFAIRFIAGRAHRIICVSNFVKANLLRFGLDETRCRVIYNTHRVTDPAWETTAGAFKKRYCLEGSHSPLVAYVGNLSEYKGALYFLKAAGLISDKFPAVRFFLIGDVVEKQSEPYKLKLLNYIKTSGLETQIIYTGFLPGAIALMPFFDCIVVPSLWADSMPLTVSEAMNHGVPVVASNVGGIPEMIRHGENGFLCKPGDETEIASAVEILLNDEGKRGEMGRRSREIFFSEFAPEKCLQDLLDLIRKTAAS